MTDETRTGAQSSDGRDDRLKAALKANLARRKAQARARRAKGAEKAGSVTAAPSGNTETDTAPNAGNED